jgi:quinol monooxygenase YgiN
MERTLAHGRRGFKLPVTTDPEFDSPPLARDHAGMLKSILIATMSAVLATSAVAENEFRHVVLFKFKPGATAEQIKEVEKAFAELPKKIESIKGYEWGPSESVEGLNDGFTHCFFVTFKDKAGLEAYLPHEAHKAFGAKLKPILEKALVFDYTAKKD